LGFVVPAAGARLTAAIRLARRCLVPARADGADAVCRRGDAGAAGAARARRGADWTAAALNRVDRAAFFAKFEEAEAVQYFYEPFLEAFDPELRKQLGVWYTPPEIVKYMVARIDAVLRSELKLADGLADPQVYVLDPCCGTGSYLVEVLHRIERTLRAKGDSALLAHDVKQVAMTRVFGFEIMPAPYVIAHWQMGLLLQAIGAPFSDNADERAGIYLTNALTGWEPPTGAKKQLTLAYPEFAEEREAAAHVKRETPILVILGNPPYNAFAGVSPEEEGGLVDIYKDGLVKTWGIKKFNLDDLYVRFFRIAERRIADGTGRGIVCFISNFSILGDPSFVVMRQRLLREFDGIWIDCMNGDSRETGKLTPQGEPDPSVFSTDHNREGIRVGTAITMLVRKTGRDRQPLVRYRDFWGIDKRRLLLGSLESSDFEMQYRQSSPAQANRFSFRPLNVRSEYLAWPTPVNLCVSAPVSGLQEMRRSALIDIDRERLAARVRRYLDGKVSWQELVDEKHGMTVDAGAFDAEGARADLLERVTYSDSAIRRYALYPFDMRWCYYSDQTPMWNRPRPVLVKQAWATNSFFVARMMAERPREGRAMTLVSALPDYHLLRPNAVAIPVRLKDGKAAGNTGPNAIRDLFGEKSSIDRPIANLSKKARAYLAGLGIDDPDGSKPSGELIWLHALGIGYSPAYLAENSAGISQDWPRVPLPKAHERLEASAALGRRLADLLDPETQVSGVTSGSTRSELRLIGNAARVGGGALKPREFEVTAGWGHAGKGGVTMPGQGKRIARAYAPDEEAAIVAGAKALGMSDAQIFDALGRETGDVYLNHTAYWSNVPANVWDYTIGGYQVIKKWLSYRELDLLGRALTADEIRYVTETARRIAAILLLQPALDANYRAVVADTYPWPRD
jgi:hypothetical protein